MKPRHFILIAITLLTLLIPSALSEENIPIDEAHFPDENFRAYVQSECDKNSDGSLSSEEISTVKELYIGRKSIASLSGIEYFTALELLACYENCLTSLDVSSNSMLRYIECNENQLETLNISSNYKLTAIHCENNRLNTLDISSSTSLTYINCSNNCLTELNVSKCTELAELDCNYNNITSLDLSNCANLFLLDCAYNKLTSINISNTKIEHIDCSHNQLQTLNLDSGFDDLGYIICYDNKLTTLNIVHCKYLMKWTYGNGVEDTVVLDNGIEYAITIYGNEEEIKTDSNVTLIAYDEKLDAITIDETHFPDESFRVYAKEKFDADNNNCLSSSEMYRVSVIYADNLGISDLSGIEYFPNLERLYCKNNHLTKLDLSKNSDLYLLDCSQNNLSSFNTSDNTKLEKVDCSGNKLTSLDLSKNPELVYLYCNDNQLTTLNVSQNLLLDDLYCQHNYLETLDITGCPIIMMRLRPEDRKVEDGVAAYRCFKTDKSVVVNGGAFPAFLDLPVNLTEIGEEAFTGAAMEAVDLSETDVETIGPRAFADCKALRYIEIEDRHTQIADDAFNGCDDLIIVTEEESIEDWANAHSLRCAKIWVGE